jgi:hypothetical protein
MRTQSFAINQVLKMDYLPLSLIALMVLTRFHHFGDALHLPDASLAVFFFASFYRASATAKGALLAFLLVLAGLIDYVAIHPLGVSDWCVSPAYVFLIPTYGVMWLAGRYCADFGIQDKTEALFAVGLAALATTAAFAISNGSFYLFSGRYADWAVTDYAAAVAQYYPSYLGAAVAYVVVGLVIANAVNVSKSFRAQA